MPDIHSTGRGGAGNIGKDASTYVDGDIIREGTPGVSDSKEYSAGRGGAGNIVHAHAPPAAASGVAPIPASEEIIPESATRVPGESYQNFHTGRGGGGNVHKDKYGGHSTAHEQEAALKAEKKEKEKHHESLLDKAKHAIGLDKK